MASILQKRRGGRGVPGSPGMSLIEVLVAVALAAIIIVAVLEIYAEGQKYFFNQNSRADTIEAIRSDMAAISRDIRDAYNIRNQASAYDGMTYTTGVDCLVLEVPSVDATGMALGGVWDIVVYSYDAGTNRLVKVVTPGGGVRQNLSRVLAIDLANPASGLPPFNLKYFNWDGSTEITSNFADGVNGAFIVELELTAQGRAIHRGGKPWIETFRTQAKLRNKIGPL